MATQKIGAGWNKASKTKNGETYVNVQVSQDIPKGSYFMIFKNDNKKLDKHPDFNVVVRRA